MITSKERGLAPFKAKKLDRFPMWYGGDPQTTQNIVDFLGAKDENDALYNILGIDYKTYRPQYAGPELQKYDDGTVDSVWGIRRAGYFYGQAVTHPLKNIEDLEDLGKKYSFPDPSLWDTHISTAEKRDAEGFCVIGGSWAPYFHDSIELIGMERFMMEMYDQPELVHAIVDRSFEFYYDQTLRAFEQNPGFIDFMFLGNDFGSQRALLMSPDFWREYFKPGIKRMVDLAHKHGAVAGLHSCGDIHAIFPDLIDIGMDAINPIQVNAEHMDPAVLKREYGKDIVFFGGIDENVILLTGTEQQVRDETRRIIDILGHDGRYIVAASHDYLLPEVPARNIVAMYDEAKKYGTGR